MYDFYIDNKNNIFKVHRGNLEEVVKNILTMTPPKKNETKKLVTIQQTEDKPKTIDTPIEKDEDHIDFVNVKDLIKGMEKKEPKEKETNGFHKRNDHDSDNEADENDSDKIQGNKENGERKMEKNDSSDSSESNLSRSSSIVNGSQMTAPKPLPRSSISEGGATEDSEAPKPKPRTTSHSSGYKVFE